MCKLIGPVVVVLVGTMLAAANAGAEERRPAPLTISAEAIQQGIATAPRNVGVPRQRATSSRHTGRRLLWTAVGAAGGFFGGAYLVAAIENSTNPCSCDDPGLKGALIGMPIGAIAGGITGFVLSK